jgi:hypothetical protein
MPQAVPTVALERIGENKSVNAQDGPHLRKEDG